jgi:homoserine kinase
MIRSRVLLKDAVTQLGNVAGLVSGLFLKDYDLIGRSLVDVLIEPTRSILIPDFYKMRALALELGAIGFGISGSGPSVFALCKDEETARRITQALQQQLKSSGINSLPFVSAVNEQGPRIID